MWPLTVRFEEPVLITVVAEALHAGDSHGIPVCQCVTHVTVCRDQADLPDEVFSGRRLKLIGQAVNTPLASQLSAVAGEVVLAVPLTHQRAVLFDRLGTPRAVAAILLAQLAPANLNP